MRKYKYLKVIQQHFGQSWEDVSEYDKSDKDGFKYVKHDVKEYRLMGYPTRVINRRELN